VIGEPAGVIEVPRHLITDRTVSPAELRVLLAIAARMPPEAGAVVVELARLSADTGVGTGDVSRAIVHAELRGLVHVVRRNSEPNTYRLGVAWLPRVST
jgi:DNA-binding MarR family transcriptional regulator